MRFLLKTLATALVIGLAVPSMSAAQGGGASSTAVLPGVTVTATSPSMIGSQSLTLSGTNTSRLIQLVARLNW